MANPSLQIGNGKWAIKEDNLLGYSKAGTRFVPEPITMTRASAGTRVNPEGLVESVELLGSEEVTNGDFATDSNWTKGTGWTISGGSANSDGTLDVGISQGFSINGNTRLQISFNIINSTGISNVRLRTFPSVTTIVTAIGDGYYSVEFLEASNITAIQFYTTSLSTGTYSLDNVSVKESTKNNLARVDYDGTASSLLAEPERTNLITYSEDFSQWIASGSMTVGNSSSVASPSNENSVGIMTGTTGTTSKFARIDVTTTSQTHTYSAFFKYNTQQFVQFASGGTSEYANFDIQNGVVGNKLSSVTSTIESFGNGWYRCTLSTSVASQPSNMAAVLIDSATSARLSSTSSTNSLYIWGASLEEGSYPTSYIPTDGSTVTRVQDQYSKTGISNLIGQTEGTLFVDVDFDTLSGLNMFLSMRPNSSNKIEIYRDGNLIYGEIASSTSFSFIKTGVTVGRYKIAFAYSSGSSAMYINGDLILSNSTSFAFTSTLNDLYVGSRGGTSFIEQAKYNDIKLYKTRLLNSELATLTTI